jgi:putative phage-type endonuclease
MIAALVRERLTGTCAETFQNAAMAWGIEHEPKARQAYEILTENDVSEVGFVYHPSLPWSGASPDGLVGDDGLVEIKCPTEATHMATLEGAAIPKNYMLQMQWQIDCCERGWCDFVSYDPRWPVAMRLHHQRVERNQEIIDQLRADVQSALDEIEQRVEKLKEQYQ